MRYNDCIAGRERWQHDVAVRSANGTSFFSYTAPRISVINVKIRNVFLNYSLRRLNLHRHRVSSLSIQRVRKKVERNREEYIFRFHDRVAMRLNLIGRSSILSLAYGLIKRLLDR